jgi:dihydrofolate reductase
VAALVYTAICSLDGYVADEHGDLGWSVPDPEVHAAVNEDERRAGTHLYGRRLYEVMVAWETVATAGQPAEIADYAQIWRAADKVVFSTTLDSVRSERTRLERSFDPAAVRQLVDTADGDVSIGGPHLAGHALRSGIVDEVTLYVSPVVVGGGVRTLPDRLRLPLEVVEHRAFGNGVVRLGYRARR